MHCTEILLVRNRSLVHVNPSPHQIRFREMENCNSRSFCHILLWGSRSTLALRLCSLQPYVPLRAGRCESLPHRSHMTGSDGGQSYLHKPQSVCSFKITQSRFYPLSNPSNASSFLLTTFLSFVPLLRSYSSKQSPSSFSSLCVR